MKNRERKGKENSPKGVGILIKKDQNLIETSLNPQIKMEEGLQETKLVQESSIKGKYSVSIIKNGVILQMNVGLAKENKREATKILSLKVTESNKECWLFHSKFGHLNFKDLNRLSFKQMVAGIPMTEILEKVCKVCLAGKQSRKAFKSYLAM
ncbi:hypothetical protein CR513_39563, partial [Mucuna pruriens]